MSLEKAQRHFVVRSPFAELIVCGVKNRIPFECEDVREQAFGRGRFQGFGKRKGIAARNRLLEKSIGKKLVAKSPEERDAALDEFRKACEKAKELSSKTDGSGMIVGEVKTGDAGILDGESGVPILECGLWPESGWVKSPGGLGVRYMPGVERPEEEPALVIFQNTPSACPIRATPRYRPVDTMGLTKKQFLPRSPECVHQNIIPCSRRHAPPITEHSYCPTTKGHGRQRNAMLKSYRGNVWAGSNPRRQALPRLNIHSTVAKRLE